MKIQIEIIRMQPQFTNSVLVHDGRTAVIFDPWGSISDWQKLLAQKNLTLKEIYLTHGHQDHTSAVNLGVPWYINPKDKDLLSLQLFDFPTITDFSMQHDLNGGDIKILGTPVKVIETPGHTLGGLAFCFPTEKTLIVGDTLFQESVGRWDMPGGDYEKLIDSINKIYNLNLAEDTLVVHGHGPETNIGWLRKNNHYFQGH